MKSIFLANENKRLMDTITKKKEYVRDNLMVWGVPLFKQSQVVNMPYTKFGNSQQQKQLAFCCINFTHLLLSRRLV